MGFGKRSPNLERFHMGFGKRSANLERFHMGFGKRSPNLERFHMGFGKRSPNLERFHMGFGKRGGDDDGRPQVFNPYFCCHFLDLSYFKRLDASKFQLGFGKRSPSSSFDEDNYIKRIDPSKMKAFGFGKRSAEPNLESDVVFVLRKFDLGLEER